jgi:hypothetical protein
MLTYQDLQHEMPDHHYVLSNMKRQKQNVIQYWENLETHEKAVFTLYHDIVVKFDIKNDRPLQQHFQEMIEEAS